VPTTYLAVFDTRVGLQRMPCASLEEAQRMIESIDPGIAGWVGHVVESCADGEQRIWHRVDNAFWTYRKTGA